MIQDIGDMGYKKILVSRMLTVVIDRDVEVERNRQGWLWQRNQRTQKTVQTVTVEVQTPETKETRYYASNKEVVILDVGGEKFTASKDSLYKFPTTRLGKLVRATTVR